MIHVRFAAMLTTLVVSQGFAMATIGDTAYLSTVLSSSARHASERNKNKFLSAERIIKDLNKFETPTSKVIFKQYVAKASETLQAKNTLQGGRLATDIVSKELASLGTVLRRTRDYIDWVYKQHLIDQVTVLPESDARHVLMTMVETMPLSSSKQDLFSHVAMLSDNLEYKNDLFEIVNGLSEWCEGKDALPNSDEIKRTFKSLSGHFYGSKYLRVAKFILKSKLFWTVTISGLLFNPWFGPFATVFFKILTKEEIQKIKKEKESSAKNKSVDTIAVKDRVTAKNNIKTKSLLSNNSTQQTDPTKTFRRCVFFKQFRNPINNINSERKKDEPELTSTLKTLLVEDTAVVEGNKPPELLCWKTASELFGLESIAEKFGDAVKTLQHLRIKAVADPNNPETGWLAKSLAGTLFQIYDYSKKDTYPGDSRLPAEVAKAQEQAQGILRTILANLKGLGMGDKAAVEAVMGSVVQSTQMKNKRVVTKQTEKDRKCAESVLRGITQLISTLPVVK